MKKTCLLFTILSISFASFSQNNPAAYFVDKVSAMSTGSRIDVNAEGDTILVSEYDTRNIKQNSNQSYERYYLGTPYLNNGWFKGKVVLEGSEPVEGLMAYNLVRNSVYYSKNQNTTAIELKPTEFTINGHSFSKFKNEIDGAGDFYYETLSLDAPMLLKMYDCKYSSSKSDVDNGYGSAKANKYEGKYEKKEKFYMVIENRMVLVTKKKSFLRSLGTYSQSAMAKVKKDKLNIKKQEDVISLSKYLSSL
ncbi:hypothetical protein [Arcticibacterium luteifluviistationis]|uniref:Uncharacterized protein n=1 Tax=Arcticibacterium luteifluviistationis TaxID=1784714 RepID=A0A2Z4GCJ4_9BACT|nr:hypothetical protein [Arcticibacterium luteifluviistationis]AWV98857.1 hypothetical protein DJ013_12020 [Arcticibacterium luteifluviistationis]